MPLPGFNAEASLYKSGVRYNNHSMSASVRAQGVMPQLNLSLVRCGICDFYAGSPFVCSRPCSMLIWSGGWPHVETWYAPCSPGSCAV